MLPKVDEYSYDVTDGAVMAGIPLDQPIIYFKHYFGSIIVFYLRVCIRFNQIISAIRSTFLLTFSKFKIYFGHSVFHEYFSNQNHKYFSNQNTTITTFSFTM